MAGENRYFEEQLTFAQGLVDIAERLRFVEPVSSRGDHLKKELIALGDDDTERNNDAIRAGDDVITNESKNQDQEGSTSSSAPVADDNVCSRNTSDSDGSRVMTEKDRNGDDNNPDPRSSKKFGDGGKPQEAVTEPEAMAGATSETETRGGIPGDFEAEGKGGRGKVNNSHRRRRGGRGFDATTPGGVRGYLPVCRASDPICPIVRIPPSEGHVFKTKQRAPTLVTCEIVVPKAAPVRQRMTTPALAGESGFLAGRGGGGEGAVAFEEKCVGEGLEGGKDGREAPEVTVRSSGGGEGGGGGGRAGVMRSSSRRRMENLRASTASPLNVERRSLPGSGREEVEEMIGSQVCWMRVIG